jgi:hypothetical protein
MAVLQAAALNIDSSVAINLVGWAFSLGLTFGFVRERLNRGLNALKSGLIASNGILLEGVHHIYGISYSRFRY